MACMCGCVSVYYTYKHKTQGKFISSTQCAQYAAPFGHGQKLTHTGRQTSFSDRPRPVCACTFSSVRFHVLLLVGFHAEIMYLFALVSGIIIVVLLRRRPKEAADWWLCRAEMRIFFVCHSRTLRCVCVVHGPGLYETIGENS